MKLKNCFLLLFIFNISVAKSQLATNYIDPFSLSSCYVEAHNGNKYLWNATGFFIKESSTIFLITNNHVVGGEFYINEYLRDHKKRPPVDSFPNKLTVRIYGKNYGESKTISVNLKRNGNYIYTKLYDNDKDSSTILDVVAVPIIDNNNDIFQYTGIMDTTVINPNLSLFPGEDLFVVGYPFDSGSYVLYPFWKRATIASDPNVFDAGISTFWIDATTRSGMSGSPVFFRGNISNDKGGTGFYSGVTTFLIGIYSAQNYSSELGRVIRLEKVFKKLKEMLH